MRPSIERIQLPELVTRRLLPVALTGVLALGACSGDSESDDSTTDSSAESTQTSEANQTIDYCATDTKLPLDQENLGNNSFPAAFGKNLAELTQEEEAEARSFYAEQAATNDFSSSVISVLFDRVNSVAYAEDVANEITRTLKDANSSNVKSEEYCNDATRAIQSSTFFELGGQLSEVVPLFNEDGSFLGTGLMPVVIEDSFTVLGKRDVNGTTYGTDQYGKTYVMFGDGSGLTEVKAVLDAPLEAKVTQEESDVKVSNNDQEEDNKNATGTDKDETGDTNNQTDTPDPSNPEAPAPVTPTPNTGAPAPATPAPGEGPTTPTTGTTPSGGGGTPAPTTTWAPPTTAPNTTIPAPTTTSGTLPPPTTTSPPVTTLPPPPTTEQVCPPGTFPAPTGGCKTIQPATTTTVPSGY